MKLPGRGRRFATTTHRQTVTGLGLPSEPRPCSLCGDVIPLHGPSTLDPLSPRRPVPRPFRWDLRRREQLGRLIPTPLRPPDPEILAHLRQCAAQTVATAGDSDLVFLGRSPESLFDYLSGALASTPWIERLFLLNLSIRSDSPTGATTRLKLTPPQRQAGREHLAALGLAPHELLTRPRPVALVDLVYRGATFGNLLAFLDQWAGEQSIEPAAIRRRLRIIGITERTRNSPNTWRWQQQAPWAKTFRPSALKGVSVDPRFWTHLGDRQAKTMPSHPPWRWMDETALKPSRAPDHMEGLSFAVALYETARSSKERTAFTAVLARQPTMRSQWFRSLVVNLRRRSGITTA